MLLRPEKSLLREKNQAIVVSKNKGAQREHRAINQKENTICDTIDWTEI